MKRKNRIELIITIIILLVFLLLAYFYLKNIVICTKPPTREWKVEKLDCISTSGGMINSYCEQYEKTIENENDSITDTFFRQCPIDYKFNEKLL